MSEPVVTVTSVVINVLDDELQKAFWSEVLGVGVARGFASWFVWFEPQRAGGVSVALQTVQEATEGTRRLHLDTAVPDSAAAKERIIELGGSVVADREAAGFHWSVMHDPEGNEFCVAGAH